MKRKTLKKALSAFLSLLMCMMTLLSISTPVFAATTVDAYMVDFPRDGDSNYLPMLLCDHVAAERALALQFGLQLLEQSEVLLICGDRISRGMKGEIHHAAQLGIPIIVYCEDLYLDVRKLATRAGADKKLVAMDETHPALASNEPGTDRSWEVRCLA